VPLCLKKEQEPYSRQNNIRWLTISCGKRLILPSSNLLKFDRAIVTFHVADAHAGLQQMDQIPQEGRTGDYYLARMQMLEALGRSAEAEGAFKEALKARPTRPELYRQVALLLIKKQRNADAIRLLDEAGRILPNDPDISRIREIADARR
jgi:predicted Zn-dependent protease